MILHLIYLLFHFKHVGLMISYSFVELLHSKMSIGNAV